jgi:hypothetical protein
MRRSRVSAARSAPPRAANAVEQGQRLGLARRQLQYFEAELLGLPGIVLTMQFDRALDHRRQWPRRLGGRQIRYVELAAAHRPQAAAACA